MVMMMAMGEMAGRIMRAIRWPVDEEEAESSSEKLSCGEGGGCVGRLCKPEKGVAVCRGKKEKRRKIMMGYLGFNVVVRISIS